MQVYIKDIHIVNGPNLNLLGLRETSIYGDMPFESYFFNLKMEFPDISLHYFQSNHEGGLIDYLQSYGFDDVGIILNAAGFTHTSIALGDTVSAISAPVVEVHISDIDQREDFRKLSYLTIPCIACIKGKGLEGYKEAVHILLSTHRE